MVWCEGLSAVYPVVSPEPRVVLCVLSLCLLSCIVKGVGWCVGSESCNMGRTVSAVVWPRCLDGRCVSTLCCAVSGMLPDVWYDESSEWWRVVHM